MEAIDHISDDRVKVCPMMHLVSGNFECKDHLYQILKDAYNNFTSIHKAIIFLLTNINRRFYYQQGYWEWGDIGAVIIFCKWSLKMIFEEDGITIRESRVRLLAELELQLIDVVKYTTNCSPIRYSDFSPPWPFYKRDPLMERIADAYVEDSICYHLIDYESMLELLDQICEDLDHLFSHSKRMLVWKDMFILLRDYLVLFSKDQFHGDALKKLLIAVQNAAYKMSHYVFLKEIIEYFEDDIQSQIRAGVLKALSLKSDISTNAPLMSDELLTGYVKYVQKNLLVLMDDGAFDPTDTLKDQLKIVHEWLSTYMDFVITYTSKNDSEQEQLSIIRLDFQALARNVASVICSCFDNLEIEEMSLEISIDKINVAKAEIMKTICSLVLGEMRVTNHISDGHTKVCGMMHLLVFGHFESKDRLYQILKFVDHNFTSIHKAIFGDLHKTSLIKDIDSKAVLSLITFCKWLLKRILEEDGNIIRESHARLLGEIEGRLIHVNKYCNKYWSLSQKSDFSLPYNFYFMDSFLKRIADVYVEDSAIFYHLIDYNSMLELLEHIRVELDYYEYFGDVTKALCERFNSLRNYLKLIIEARIQGDNLEKVLIAVENAAYEISRNAFLGYFRCRNEDDVQSRTRYGVLKALVLKIDSSNNLPLMSNELLIGYVKCVRENSLELMNDKAFDPTETLKDPLKILQEGLSFLLHLLITYPSKHDSEQEHLSNVRLDFQAFAREVGSVICSRFDNLEIEEMSLRFFHLIENINVIKAEVIKTICCLVLRKGGRESPKQDQLGSLILLLQNLKDFMDRKSSLIVTWKDHENLVFFIFYLIQNSIRDGNNITDDEFSRNTLHFDVAHIDHENLSSVLISAQVVAFNMACSLLRRQGSFHWWELYWGSRDDVNSHMCVGILKALVFSLDNTFNPLTDDLLIAYVECVQDNLIELQAYTSSATMKDKINILHTGLPLLVHLLISYSDEEEKLSHIKVYFQDLLRNVASAVCSCFSDWLKGDMGTGERIELSDLVAKLKLITLKATGYLHLFVLSKIRRESPKTDQLGSLNLLLENWKELMKGESILIITWKDQFEMIFKNLVSLKSFITSTRNRDDESQNLCNSIADAGHVAEYLLTILTVDTCPVWCTSLWIPEFIEHVELIKTDVMEFNKRKGTEKKIVTAIKDTGFVSSQALLVSTSPNLVVGFEEEMELIKEKLSSDFTQLDVISIIGMPGLGKTTLARKVYEDRFTVSHFEVRAWCTVSQECNNKELFLTILGSKIEVKDEIKEKNETELSTMVHQLLMGRRYLIVLDDVWSIDAFNELSLFFPDNNQGSRIMLTSRIKVTGSKAKHLSDPIEPGMLTDEESWELIEHKVFRDGKCPLELCQIGNVIAIKCRGLPLAVVVVAGILVKSAENREFWNEVAENLSSYRDSQSHVMATLELSYKYLPDCLKPMFLYLGVFPEDEEISADKLMQLWMAEGFVQKTESKNLESQAEKNLMDLIDRSLIMVAKRRWDDSVKTCHIHDLLRDMCLAKAKEENFMEQVLVHCETPYPVMYRRRLSIFFERNDVNTSRHLASYKVLPVFLVTPPIYSLLFFYVGPRPDDFWIEGITPVISSLKLLKVFDAQVNIAHFSEYEDLMKLVHLRYLALCIDICQLPSMSIWRLRNLETLIIKGPNNQCIEVDEAIWEMAKLRHLHIGRAEFSAKPENPLILDNLQTLSMPVVRPGEEENLFIKVPSLKKIKCELFLWRSNHYNLFNFESLGNLESLTLRLECNDDFPDSQGSEFKLPLTLKTLSLSEFFYKRSQLSYFHTLPNLEVLKLKHNIVMGFDWYTRDDDVFSNLKILELKNLFIRRWSASSVNFPSLEKLVLQQCRKLEQIPSELGEFYSLRKIEVINCNSYVAEMVRKIEREQEEIGYEMLTVYIEEDFFMP